MNVGIIVYTDSIITGHFSPTDAQIIVLSVAGVAVTRVVALQVDTCAIFGTIEQGFILTLVNI